MLIRKGFHTFLLLFTILLAAVCSFGNIIQNDDICAEIESINFSQNVVFIDCDEDQRCTKNAEKVDIWTKINNPDGDVVTFKYEISAGKIIGKDEKVIWDLTGVGVGEKRIKVTIDDSCKPSDPDKKIENINVIKCPKLFETGYPPSIAHFELSRNKILRSKEKLREVRIKTFDNFNSTMDVIYRYKVSVGKIIGSGSKVIWDLSEIKTGIYTISVSIDYGNGFCQNLKTEVISIE